MTWLVTFWKYRCQAGVAFMVVVFGAAICVVWLSGYNAAETDQLNNTLEAIEVDKENRDEIRNLDDDMLRGRLLRRPH